jgi:hypothetical protein
MRSLESFLLLDWRFPMWKKVKFLLRLLQVFFAYNYSTAAGYWLGRRAEKEGWHENFRDAVNEVAETFNSRIAYHLGYSFYLADMREGYYD